MKRLLVLAAIGSVPYASAYFCIDDFTSGNYEYQTKSTSHEDLQAGTMAGGYRLILSSILANPTGRALYYINIGDGLATVESGTRLQNSTAFGYGHEPASGGYALKDLNLDLSGESAFQIDFLSNESDLQLEVAVRSSEQFGGTWVSQTMTVAGGRTGTPFSELVSFGNFSGFDFSNLDQLWILFTNTPSGDYALTGIKAVPEPATVAALMAGGLAVLTRRRRR